MSDDGTLNTGASVPEQALVASPSNPQAVSTEGFDPSRVWVLFCSTGEWSDRAEWPIGFVRDEATAERLTIRAGEEWSAANVLHPRVEYPDSAMPWEEMTEERCEAEEAAYREAQATRDAAIGLLLTVHPEAVSSCQYDDPYYFFREVAALPASAIDARRAATAQTGAVHESAVGNAETPDVKSGPHHPPEGE